MKEFHLVFAKAENKAQFVQLCHDSFNEMTRERVGYINSANFFNKYYNLDFDLLQVTRLAKFIKSGHYKDMLEMYLD